MKNLQLYENNHRQVIILLSSIINKIIQNCSLFDEAKFVTELWLLTMLIEIKIPLNLLCCFVRTRYSLDLSGTNINVLENILNQILYNPKTNILSKYFPFTFKNADSCNVSSSFSIYLPLFLFTDLIQVTRSFQSFQCLNYCNVNGGWAL